MSKSIGPQPARKELVTHAEGASAPLCIGTGNGFANFTADLGCSAAGNELAKGAIPPPCTEAGNVLANFTAGLGCSGVRKQLAEGTCPPLGTVTY